MTRSKREKKPAGGKGSRLRVLDIIIYAVIACVLVGGGIAGYLFVSAYRSLPAMSYLEPETSETSIIYDRNGDVWTELHSTENRVPVKLKDLPKQFVDAVLAAEDNRFYQHHGVDIRGIFRALVNDILERGQGGLQGGSTISQQLAKKAFLTDSQNIKRKIQDAILAVKLEQQYTKDEILEMYVNIIPYGRGAYSPEAAARAFFGKSIKDVTVDEAAFIAGMIRGPYIYDPADDPDAGLARRNTVLDQMAAYGYISQDQAAEFKAKPLNTISPNAGSSAEGAYFLDYVLKQLLAKYSPEQVYGGGLRIYTTYSPEAQRAADKAISDTLDKDFPYKGADSMQAAAVVMDVKTGGILAMVGGRQHEGMLAWNRAIDTKRQPGSSFKPLAVYIPALEAGMSPGTIMDDSPVTFVDPTTKEEYSPTNYDGTFSGLVTLRTAVMRSLNVVASKVQDMIGFKKSLETAEKMGITSLVKDATPDGRNDYTRSLALGGLTYGVSPLDMAVAYGTIANRGIKVDPLTILRVEDKNGTVLEEHKTTRTLVVSEESAYLMTSMMADGIRYGTGAAAYFGKPSAGKTGTTSDWKDAWFCGFTPNTVGIVWMGFDQEKTMQAWKITGGSYPALMWNRMMKQITANDPAQDFQAPSDIVSVKICNKSGLLPGPNCPASDIVTEQFVKDRVPKAICTYPHR